MPISEAYTEVSPQKFIPIKEYEARVSRCRVHAAWLILPCLILVALQVGFAAFLFHRTKTVALPHITLVIDLNSTQRCIKSPDERKYPCVSGEVYSTADEPLGPLRCRDDAFDQLVKAGAGSSSLRDNCLGNPFRIASDGKGVVIPEDGLYRVYARITFFDKVSHHLAASIRIDQSQNSDCLGSHVCLSERSKQAHTWLSCFAHQPSSVTSRNREFTSCSLDGIRKFSAGEVVGLQVAVGYRDVSAHYKATNMYIHKL